MEIHRRTPFLAPQSFGDLLDNTFRMMGRTWRTSLPLVLALLLPLSALTGWVTARGLAGMLPYLVRPEGSAAGLFPAYLRFLAGLTGSLLLLSLAALFVQVAVGTRVAAEVGGQRSPRPGAVVALAGRRWFVPTLLQGLVQAALLTGLWTAVLLIVLPLAALALAGGRLVLPALLGSLGGLSLGAAAVVWLSVLLRFAPQAVVFDGEPCSAACSAAHRWYGAPGGGCWASRWSWASSCPSPPGCSACRWAARRYCPSPRG